MGISSTKSKTKTVNSPYGPAQAAIDTGLQSAQQLFTTQQPILNQNAALAQQAYQSLAPQVFQTSPYVADAQKSAQAISGGTYLGQNPGAGTYANLQSAGSNNPSLTSLQAMVRQGPNPADAQARATAGGQYLNAQPSAQFYADTLSGKYLNANPYLDAIVKQSDDAATKAVNQRFAASGMGAGLSTPYADLLSKNLADSENSLRYGAYNDELARMGQIGGQSDATWNAERGRMDEANGLLASDYNANQDRALSAANSLGSQYNADNATRLGAAQAADAAQNQEISQMLQALGMTGDLSNAQYAGVAPALSLLNTASQTPYYGLQAYAGALDTLAGRYGTSTTKSSQSPSAFDQIQKGLDFGSQLAARFPKPG